MLNSYVPRSTMVAVDPLKGPSSDLMTCSENFRFNHNYVNRSLPKIISYLTLADSSTWKFRITIFVALSWGKVKYILTLWLVVILPGYMCHCITAHFLGLIFSISLLIIIMELHPLSNRIREFLIFDLPFCVFIHPCRIGEQWIFFGRLEGFSISCSKLHLDILFTFFSCIQLMSFSIYISYIFSILLSNAHLRHSFSSRIYLSSS